jgi:hypothetical protein
MVCDLASKAGEDPDFAFRSLLETDELAAL